MTVEVSLSMIFSEVLIIIIIIFNIKTSNIKVTNEIYFIFNKDRLTGAQSHPEQLFDQKYKTKQKNIYSE